MLDRIVPRKITSAKTARTVAATAKPDPKSEYFGDIDVPWNVGLTVFRMKAARDMTIVDPVIEIKEIVSPSGAPIVLEAWRNGSYGGSTTLAMGANSFPSVPLKKLDEIELRVCVKGDRTDKTEAKGVWLVYCVS